MSDESKTALPMADANGERCETCRFFLLMGNYSESVLDDGTREVDGICRRFPPSLSVHAIEMLLQGRAGELDGPGECSQPGVWGGEWCGEWQPKKPA